MSITEERREKFFKVASQRQFDLTVVLENVHDPHNIGAVMRTCDSVGISEIFILNTDERLKDKRQFFGKATASGARKWIKVNYFENEVECFATLKSRYEMIAGTHLSQDSRSLYNLDLSKSCALVFGNEHDGISKSTLKFLDANFLIPQFGMVQSLNISVACAVSLYEACRQRIGHGQYEPKVNSKESKSLFQDFLKKDGRFSEKGINET